MCGIAGFFTPPRIKSSAEMTAEVTVMTDAIRLRGPDDAGAWVEPEVGVALGHRRLAILDLSPLGHQPMASVDGRYVMVFNGEIYNYRQLRAELETYGFVWRGHSDTEVMLAACCQWGIRGALQRFNGMFAFAVWDKDQRELTLARDRMGEKPLYYGWLGDRLVFASELKAIRALPGFQAGINRDALCAQLRFNYIPDPWCIYKGLRKLPPGGMITVTSPYDKHEPELYWNLRQVIEQGLDQPFRGSEREAVDTFEDLLKEAVSLRMVADVPLGAFLSGGVDSSLIVAMMQAQSAQPVRTFTIGFDAAEYNEAHFAKEVAQHLRTEHTEMMVTGKDALEVIPQLPSLYDEPFSDYSQIPTYLVCKMARQHVTVALSGDAGDELFGGYERYFVGRELWNKFAWMPPLLKRAVAAGMTALPPGALNTLGTLARPILPRRLRHVPFGDKLHKLAEVVSAPGMEKLYLTLMSHWKRPEEIVIGGRDQDTSITNTEGWPRVSDFTHRMMHLDMETYLPGDILTKVDRAAMGVSLETRIPLLDTRLIEFAWSIPFSMKVHEGQGKWLMRETLYRHVPKALIDRPKRGFGVPLEHWLRGELRDWAEDLLSESRLNREGYFQAAPIRKKWQEHLRGTRNWHFYLWDVLMFQAWLSDQKR
jgi:asparagine synthase (glutamine-hydrolysing)